MKTVDKMQRSPNWLLLELPGGVQDIDPLASYLSIDLLGLGWTQESIIFYMVPECSDLQKHLGTPVLDDFNGLFY